MIKTTAFIFVIAVSVLAIAISAFSLNFDGISIYPIVGDDLSYQSALPQQDNLIQVPMS